MEITSQDLLVVVDVQNDFCPGGVLPVPGGDQVIDIIHQAANEFQHVILTQDWHPRGHASFASTHPGYRPLQVVKAAYGDQTLWPDHCVQGTPGAEFHPLLSLPKAELILRKGYRAEVDSYSAFFENDRITPTGLAGYLLDRGLKRAFFAGLAYDFCVGFSALDATRLGFAAVILLDACRAIDVGDSVSSIEGELRAAGVSLTTSVGLR
jgi:nicotinamidase/pyrazinamidase